MISLTLPALALTSKAGLSALFSKSIVGGLLAAQLTVIAPHVSGDLPLLSKIESAIESHCSALPRNLVLAVIRVESNFIVGAVNARSNDYGIMQVNKYHLGASGLSKQRLVTDADYNIKAGCDILTWFVKTYGEVEGVMRYNGGTGKGVLKWKSVKRYGKKVLHYKSILDQIEKSYNYKYNYKQTEK